MKFQHQDVINTSGAPFLKEELPRPKPAYTLCPLAWRLLSVVLNESAGCDYSVGKQNIIYPSSSILLHDCYICLRSKCRHKVLVILYTAAVLPGAVGNRSPKHLKCTRLAEAALGKLNHGHQLCMSCRVAEVVAACDFKQDE